MAVPGISSSADVHVDQVLTNLVIGYGRPVYIADKILPTLTVSYDTGKFYKWERNNINITGLNLRRADRAKAHEVNLDVSLDTYTMEQYALRDFLEDSIRKNADSQINVEQSYSQNVIDLMDLSREKQIADTVFDTNLYASSNKVDLDTTNCWSNLTHADSDPKEDIASAKQTVLLGCGVIPNTLIMGWKLKERMKRHSKVLASVQYVQKTGYAYIPDSELASYLGVDSIIDGSAVYNSSAEGVTSSNAFVWDDHALLVYLPPAGGGINIPAYGYQFVPGHTPRVVHKYQEVGMNGYWIEVNEKRFNKLTFPNAAFLFTNADRS